MSTRKALIGLFIVAVASLTGCQSGGSPPVDDGIIITGMIVDASSPSTGVADAYVYVPPKGADFAARQTVVSTTSTADGSYSLTGVPSGRQRLIVEPPAGSGLSSVEISIDAPEAESLSLRITLARSDTAGDIAAIAIMPQMAVVEPGGTLDYVATVISRTGEVLEATPTWLVTDGVGQMDADGHFTAGATEGTGVVVAALAGVVGTTGLTVGGGNTNAPPYLGSLTATSLSLLPGEVATLRATATDADGDSLTYSWFAAGAPANGVGAQITWTAPTTAGLYTVTCTVDDGRGGSDSKSVAITVSATAPANPFAGFWAGEYQETTEGLTSLDYGFHTMSVAADGGLVAHLWGAQVGSFTGVGSISTSGYLSASADIAGLCHASFEGQLVLDGTGSGTFTNVCTHQPIIHIGTWDTRRQDAE